MASSGEDETGMGSSFKQERKAAHNKARRPKAKVLIMATKQAGYQVDDDQAVDVPREHAPKVASRVTVNLSRRTVEALKATSALTDDTKTEVINKAVQLYREIQEAQSKGGGVFIQSDEDKDPVLVRFY